MFISVWALNNCSGLTAIALVVPSIDLPKATYFVCNVLTRSSARPMMSACCLPNAVTYFVPAAMPYWKYCPSDIFPFSRDLPNLFTLDSTSTNLVENARVSSMDDLNAAVSSRCCFTAAVFDWRTDLLKLLMPVCRARNPASASAVSKSTLIPALTSFIYLIIS